MKKIYPTIACLMMLTALAACGTDETTIVHEHPVVVQPVISGMTPDAVEANCVHGYDNKTHSCY